MLTITADSADEAWLAAARKLLRSPDTRPQESRAGPTREILHVSFTIRNPRQRWVISRQPAMNPAFALAELVWIMAGRNDSDFVNFWNPVLPRFSGYGHSYHGAYGFRLRQHFGVDQLTRAYHVLKNNPDSRQVVLQLWDPRGDLPSSDGTPADADIPCNICSLLKVRNGKLEWLQVIRSNDLFLGVPYNFVQFTSLQEIMAGWLGVELGEYVQISDSLHIYVKDLHNIGPPNRVVATVNTDRLSLEKHESESLFRVLAERMQRIATERVDANTLEELSLASELPQAFRNILAIVGADAARRHKIAGLARRLANTCTNDCLRTLWFAWQDRNEVRQHKRAAV